MVCVTDANRLLEAAPAEQLEKFAAVMNAAAARWNKPEKGQPAKPFHLVLQVAPGEESAPEKRMQAAGMKLGRLKGK